MNALGEKIRDFEERLSEVERVNAWLEDLALTTARALGEISRHWDAVYDARRRAERVDDAQPSSERDLAASGLRRQADAVPAPPKR